MRRNVGCEKIGVGQNIVARKQHQLAARKRNRGVARAPCPRMDRMLDDPQVEPLAERRNVVLDVVLRCVVGDDDFRLAGRQSLALISGQGPGQLRRAIARRDDHRDRNVMLGREIACPDCCEPLAFKRVQRRRQFFRRARPGEFGKHSFARRYGSLAQPRALLLCVKQGTRQVVDVDFGPAGECGYDRFPALRGTRRPQPRGSARG